MRTAAAAVAAGAGFFNVIGSQRSDASAGAIAELQAPTPRLTMSDLPRL